MDEESPFPNRQAYSLENIKMHESIVKQVYLDGTNYKIKEEDAPIIQQFGRGIPDHSAPIYAAPKGTAQKKQNKKQKKVTIQTLNKSDGAWWKNLFPCCGAETVVVPEFQDCGQCGRRVYEQDSDSSEEQPYISRQRMKEREKQPINVFYDRIKNNQLMKTSWQ